MTMMKTPVILAACILLLSALTVLASESTFGPSECCFEFVSKRLPKKGVLSYKYTDKQCPHKAVLLKMRNGKEYCTSLSAQWVKDIVEAKAKELQ
uniref:C-C motif chemokine 4 homolog n=1 Tax=Semicossyphus pulcher TaxID=241346 RepID=UPI0037E886AE